MYQIESEKVSEVGFISHSDFRQKIFTAGCILTLGLLWVMFRWFPEWRRVLYLEAADLDSATHLYILKKDRTHLIVELHRRPSRVLPSLELAPSTFIWFDNRLYLLKEGTQTFATGSQLMYDYLHKNPEAVLEARHCLTPNDAAQLQELYGPNIIRLEGTSYIDFVVTELFQPFVIWQLFSMTLFMLMGFLIYGALMFCIMVYSSLVVAWSKRQSREKIRMVAEDVCQVRALRNIDGALTEVTISSQDLVVGDVVRIQRGDVFTVDMIMLSGSCIVSEAVITGEANPVRKVGVISEAGIGDCDFQDANLIHCGSKCLMNKTPRVEGLVVRTGWSTSKGELISDIINSKVVEFKFKQDVNRILTYLFLSGMAFCTILFFLMFRSKNFTFKKFLLKWIEIMMLVMPAPLMVCFTSAIKEATSKLEEGGVLPIIIDKINEAGRVKFACFDKTGTLTEVSVTTAGYSAKVGDEFEIVYSLGELDRTPARFKIQEALGACHSLQFVNGQVVGDPLDEETFRSSGFIMEEEDNGGHVHRYLYPSEKFRAKSKLPASYRLEVITTNEFSPERKRMSVVAIDNGDGGVRSLIKGAPEVIKKIASSSSIPSDFDDLVNEYSQKGYRTIALGYKSLGTTDPKLVTVDDAETDFEFIGFVLLSNPVKPETKPVIDALKAVDIETRMITGDNIYTALNVACVAGIVEESDNIFLGVMNPKTGLVKYRFLSYSDIKKNEIKINIDASAVHPSPSNRGLERLSRRGFDPRQSAASILEVLLRCKESGNTKIAIEGAAFEKEIAALEALSPSYVDLFFELTVIFARTNPKQKETIVEKLKACERCQKNTYTVAFVGDGSNDSKALRVANIGLSLGSNESSIASSFNTKTPNIQPLIKVLCEGRGALDLGIQTFKFIMIANLCQFISIDTLSLYQLDFCSIHYLFNDFFTICVPGMLMCQTRSLETLNKNIPRVSILNSKFFATFLVQLVIYLSCILVLVQFMIYGRYSKPIDQIVDHSTFTTFDDHGFLQNTFLIFILDTFIMGFGVAINHGFPFRQQLSSNLPLCLYFVFNISLHLSLVIEPEIDNYWWSYFGFRYFNLSETKGTLRNQVLALGLLAAVISYIAERIVKTYFLIKKRVLNEIVRRQKAQEALTASMAEDKSFVFKALSQN